MVEVEYGAHGFAWTKVIEISNKQARVKKLRNPSHVKRTNSIEIQVRFIAKVSTTFVYRLQRMRTHCEYIERQIVRRMSEDI